jgi:hypothetical protein
MQPNIKNKKHGSWNNLILSVEIKRKTMKKYVVER